MNGTNEAHPMACVSMRASVCSTNRQSDDQRDRDLHFFHPEMSSVLLYNIEYHRLLSLWAGPVGVNCGCEVPP